MGRGIVLKLYDKARLASRILPRMGARYVGYRVKHALDTRLGRLRKRFPLSPPLQPVKQSGTLNHFRQHPPSYLFRSDALQVSRRPDATLAQAADALAVGEFTYFSASTQRLDLASAAAWITHPISGVPFPMKHWSDVSDLDSAAGDIKYVWEPSRFSHFLTLIRDDYHNGTDRGPVVFDQLSSWLEANPINQGPNYKCSQEISLRLLNWSFALHYYRQHDALTDDLWQRMLQNIYWSIHHVYHHINFSRIAVRNNHAITETMLLWLSAHLFPWFSDFQEWSAQGKTWLEEELAYQIHEDGTYIQHSHNYQRVVVQLLSVGLRFGERFQDRLSDTAYARARSMVDYLRGVQRPNGWLPNYGANDGALFFPLATQHYRDYRPQLHALADVLGLQTSVDPVISEEAEWLGVHANPSAVLPKKKAADPSAQLTREFPVGGIYTWRDQHIFVSLKAQTYRDRPSQSDNLHLDFWLGNENILRDQGTYRYNTDRESVLYFNGNQGHNSVLVNGAGQFEKGPRFIWLDWHLPAQGRWVAPSTFEGFAKGFKQSGRVVVHHRRVEVAPAGQHLTITDWLENAEPGTTLTQVWHPNPDWLSRLTFDVTDSNGQEVDSTSSTGSFSGFYGIREEVTDFHFHTQTSRLVTRITWA